MGGLSPVGEGIIANLPNGSYADGRRRRMGLVLVSTPLSRARMKREFDLVASGGAPGLEPHWGYWDVFQFPELVVGNFTDLSTTRYSPTAAEPFSAYLDRHPKCEDWRSRFGRIVGSAGEPRWRHGLRRLLVDCLEAAHWSEYVCVNSRHGLRALDLYEKVFTPGLFDENSEPVYSNHHILNAFAPWRLRAVPDPLYWWMYADHVCLGQCEVTLGARAPAPAQASWV